MTVETQQVVGSGNFTIDITLSPSEPVKAWELKIRYDHSLLELLSIREGNFFQGYETFYINNRSIAYDLILGHGNVSTPGIIAKAVFKPLGEGNAFVQVYDVGITNETRYLPLTILNGTVTILGDHRWVSSGYPIGWNCFQSDTKDIHQDGDELLFVVPANGWNDFQNNVAIGKGWSSFRSQPEPTDIGILASVFMAIGFIAVIIMVCLRRLR